MFCGVLRSFAHVTQGYIKHSSRTLGYMKMKHEPRRERERTTGTVLNAALFSSIYEIVFLHTYY